MTSFQPRVDAIREQVDIAEVIGRVVKLGGGAKPRGKCPFHGSKSDSFSVDPDAGRARCWGCSWSGDAIAFVRDFFNLGFVDALARLEAEHGLDGLSAAPVRREKRTHRRSSRPVVDSLTFGRLLWKRARSEPEAVRVYLRSRGVPDAVLGDDRLTDIRFLSMGPIRAWREDRGPEDVPQAPAIVALVRLAGDWSPIGVHATFLRPDLAGKMDRRRDDGEPYPARKMLGAAGGGCVVLGKYADDVPLFVGEGLETVLSGMALAKASAEACGLAALSLDNLQGHWRLQRGALPLFDVQPDPDGPSAIAFGHAGIVTGLIDADMKPLRGPIDRATGQPRGVPLIERPRGPVIRRALGSAERSEICGALFAHAWRAKGCRVRAIRPRMGQDFNDAVREARA